MRKIIIALGIAALVGGSTYTVYNYNRSINNNTNSSSGKQSISATQNEAVPSSTPSSEQDSKNKLPSNQSMIKNVKVKAVDFKLKDLSGKEVSLSDYKGKKVFLNFWATWCPPCRAEMPELEKLYKETKDSDLVILTVNLGEDKNTVQKFIDDNKYNFKVLLDIDNEAAIKYQVVSIPTSYFIDKEGNIIDKHIGAMSIEDMKSYINNIK